MELEKDSVIGSGPVFQNNRDQCLVCVELHLHFTSILKLREELKMSSRRGWSNFADEREAHRVGESWTIRVRGIKGIAVGIGTRHHFIEVMQHVARYSIKIHSNDTN